MPGKTVIIWPMKGNGEGKVFLLLGGKVTGGSCAYNTGLPEKYGGEVRCANVVDAFVRGVYIGRRGGGSVECTFQVVGEMRLGRLGWLR